MFGFKLFMVAMMLLVPGTMIGFGRYWQKKPPKQINGAYGYRTRRSMINKETWDYAHEVCAVFWLRAGWVVLILSLISAVLMLMLELNTEQVGEIGCIAVFVQIVPMVVAFPVTETALKRKFGF